MTCAVCKAQFTNPVWFELLIDSSHHRKVPSWPPPSKITMTPAAAALHGSEAMPDGAIDLTVFVSCFNEELLITETLNTVREALREVGGISYEIIVIDDCSRDCSVDRVECFIKAHPEERLMLRANESNRGLAQNYVDGAFFGRGRYYRLICGDNPEPKDALIAIFRELGRADILIPYYVTVEGKSLKRRLFSATYTRLVNAISGFRLHYYNGPAVHLREAVMRWNPNTRGFGFQAAILCRLIDQGFTYIEIPARGVDRKGRDSRALTLRNLLSVLHVWLDVVLRRISNRLYRWI